MNRIATVIIAVSGLTLGSLAAAASDYSCPPGAKFCPPPPSAGTASPGGYNDDFGSYQPASFASSSSNQGYHESQLNEGETLIMVAPGGGTPGMLTAGSVFKGPPADYAAPAMGNDGGSVAAGGMIDYGSDPSYNFMPANSHSGPVSAMAAPAAAFGGNENNGGAGNGFMPPPPGFVPPPPGSGSSRAGGSVASSSNAKYGDDYANDAPPAAVRSPAAAGESRSAALANAPTKSQQQPPYHEAYGEPSRKQPAVSSVPAPGPTRSSSQAQAKPSRPAAKGDDLPMAGPAKKKKADQLFSEVANETSKKNRNSGSGNITSGKKSSSETKRIPWWKGGMFRNKKNPDADTGKAGKAKNKKKNDKGGR